ncbi:MAG: hypothetical protein GF329_17655 [Candidatus Lokiarchaeota archaeon]|nr:hypothetical protein [Candidatus Lokiarchaeota archaeon]
MTDKLNSRSLKELLKISKNVYNETFLEGYLINMGNRKEKFLNKLRENKKNARRNVWITKIVAAIFFIVMDIFLIFIILNFQFNVGSVNPSNFSSFLFATSVCMSVLFLIKILYFFVYSITSLSGVFTGNAFKMLEILPLKKTEIQKVAFFVFLRSLDLMILIIFLGFPIITIIFTLAFLPILMSFLLSAINLLYSISIVSIIVYLMSKKLFTASSRSKGKSVLRILVTVGYAFTMIFMSFVFGFLYDWIEDLMIGSLSWASDMSILNSILCFIYPFSISYLFGISMLPFDKIYLNQILVPIIGIIVSVLLGFLLFRVALKFLRSITREEDIHIERKKDKSKLKIEIDKTSPHYAIFKKDVFYILRNFSSSFYMFMPILLPLLGFLQVINISGTGMEKLMSTTIMTLFYIGGNLFMVLMASTTSENETGGLIFTIPVKQSTIYKGKSMFMMLIMFLSLLATSIASVILFYSQIQYVILSILALGIIYFYSTELTLILYSFFVGKTKSGYTLYNLNPTNKIIKAIVGIIIVYMTAFTPILLSILIQMFLFPTFLYAFFISEIIIAVIILITIRLIARRMFK